jgi:hypothetical protein
MSKARCLLNDTFLGVTVDCPGFLRMLAGAILEVRVGKVMPNDGLLKPTSGGDTIVHMSA